jgi:hypothetical protein
MHMNEEELTDYNREKEFLINQYRTSKGWHKLISLSSQLSDLILSGKEIELIFNSNGMWKNETFNDLNMKGTSKGTAVYNYLEVNHPPLKEWACKSQQI